MSEPSFASQLRDFADKLDNEGYKVVSTHGALSLQRGPGETCVFPYGLFRNAALLLGDVERNRCDTNFGQQLGNWRSWCTCGWSNPKATSRSHAILLCATHLEERDRERAVRFLMEMQ